ncbi:hypothetical protein E2C01_012780 [Portunus trituberculatus]|uniref:Uncharacterized protein n=1 Tax=Portunus trituberculatus TaxID=210409 RepID=A0A5B7DFC0_PORTR|nr:hypothetical protein [Portunus trituberculatus]
MNEGGGSVDVRQPKGDPAWGPRQGTGCRSFTLGKGRHKQEINVYHSPDGAMRGPKGVLRAPCIVWCVIVPKCSVILDKYIIINDKHIGTVETGIALLEWTRFPLRLKAVHLQRLTLGKGSP